MILLVFIYFKCKLMIMIIYAVKTFNFSFETESCFNLKISNNLVHSSEIGQKIKY
jgi:hypothetical protein